MAKTRYTFNVTTVINKVEQIKVEAATKTTALASVKDYLKYDERKDIRSIIYVSSEPIKTPTR